MTALEAGRFGWSALAWIWVLLVTCSLANHNKWWTCSSACARCARRVTPMEDLIIQFYPGLFSSTPPVNVYLSPEMSDFATHTHTVNSGQASIPTSAHARRNNSGILSRNISHSRDNPAVWEITPNESTPRAGHRAPSTAFGCCETVMEYVTPPNVTIRGQVYRVVHLRHAFQFLPIGKCRPDSTCSYGECVEQYRAHWVLIYNSSKTVRGPPVSFSPVEVPSHCECLNVGRP